MVEQQKKLTQDKQNQPKVNIKSEKKEADKEESVFKIVIGKDRFLKFSLVFTVGFLIAFISWLGFAQLDKGVIASGSIVVDSKRKVIQHLEGGIIKQILITENEKVEALQPLIIIDDTQSQSRLNQVEGRLFSSLAHLNRLQAERKKSNRIIFDQRLIENVEKESIAELVIIQQNLFEARRDNINGQIEILGQRILQLKDKVIGLEGFLEATRRQKVSIEEELGRYKTLEAKQRIDARAKTSRLKELGQIEGEIARVVSEIAGTKISINETKEQILQVRRDFYEKLSGEIAEVQDSVFELEDNIIYLKDVLARTVIRAPIAGSVLNLRYATIGGVIPPGEAIMEVIPTEDILVVEARVRAIDIENVYDGQEVRASFNAYTSGDFSEIKGKVQSIAADANVDRQTNESYYLIRIILSDSELQKSRDFEIVPGMPVEVFIYGGQRTTWQYLIQPIEEAIRRGLREN